MSTAKSPEALAHEIVQERYDCNAASWRRGSKIYAEMTLWVETIAEVIREAEARGEARAMAQVEELERVAAEWMTDYDALVAKYEPLVGVTSGPKAQRIVWPSEAELAKKFPCGRYKVNCSDAQGLEYCSECEARLSAEDLIDWLKRVVRLEPVEGE